VQDLGDLAHEADYTPGAWSSTTRHGAGGRWPVPL
jgi:hypothetical protein